MKFSINTEKLQNTITSVAKGVGNNKLLPVTELVGITLTDSGVVKFSSADGVNTLRVSTDLDGDLEQEPGEITVNADLFTSLVSKLSDCTSVTFNTSDRLLIVTGHKGDVDCGVYKIELPVDESGNIIKPINLDAKINIIKQNIADNIGTVYELTKTTIDEMRSSCRQALAVDVTESCYTNYLISKSIMATDRTRAVFIHKDIIGDNHPFLISRTFGELLSLIVDEVSILVSDSGIYASDGKTIEIYTNTRGDLADYDEKALNGMLGMSFPSMCKVKKSELLNTLGRMSLFCEQYDNNAVDITFQEDCLTIKSLKDSAVESINFLEHKDYAPCDIRVDVTLLISHVKAYGSDSVELWFGHPKCIKFVDGDITQILALVAK